MILLRKRVCSLQTKIKKFSELTLHQYHYLMANRVAVFVVEQACPYQEIDAIDMQAYHFWLEDEQANLLAYARVYSEEQLVHFGRVLVKKKERGKGLGKELVRQIIEWIQVYFPGEKMHIEAQTYLYNFYTSFGFEAVSEEYLEDGIPHINMEKNDYATS